MIQFLNRVCDTESEVSCKYYLMYYLLIVCECKIHKHLQAEVMYKALQKQERLLKIAGIKLPKANNLQDVDISSVQSDSTKILYHPQEIIFWKYATYLNLNGYEPFAIKYYEKAVEICFKRKEYLTRYVTGIGIEAERISCLFQMKKQSDAMKAYNMLKWRIEELEKEKLPMGMKLFCRKVRDVLQSNREAMWEVSRMITY